MHNVRVCHCTVGNVDTDFHAAVITVALLGWQLPAHEQAR